MRRSFAPAAVLAASAVLTIAATAFLRASSEARDEERFARAVRTTQDRIEGRLETYGAMLRATAAFLAAQPGLSREDFAAYVARLELQSRYPGLQGVASSQHVRRAFSGDLVAKERARGFSDFEIHPDYGGEEREVVVLIEPLDRRNAAALGFDMWTDPTRREAIQRGRDSGAAALSGRLTLVQELDGDRQAGFILYMPVYRMGAKISSVAERREALLGFATIAFRADDLFEGIFGREARPVLDFEIYDGPAAVPEALLHARSSAPLLRGPVSTTHLQIFGRTWTITFSALPELRRASTLPFAPILFGAGVLFSLVLYALTRGQAQARDRAEATAAELRRSLEERERVEQRVRDEARISDTLRRVGTSMAAELDHDRLVQLVLDEAKALTGAETAAFDPALTGEAVVREDHSQGPVRSLLSVPIVSRAGGVMGGLVFGHVQPGRFTQQHERLVVGLAAQASIALDNARLYRDLRESDRHKDEFLAVLGHELRNPLAPIVTALEVMRLDPESVTRQRAVIERQARHMVRLVDDLLDVSRISRGKIELRKERVSVRDAIAKAVEAAGPLLKARRHSLQVDLPERPLLVEADPVRLDQVLMNLLTNAAKYTPEGGHVRIDAAQRAGQLELRVSDDGIGFQPDAAALLFLPFEQLGGARDYAAGGLGIGLALVKGLVQLHGGTVSASSPGPGRGATFVVRLPGPLDEAETPPLGTAVLRPRSAPGRLLFVDDNVDAVETLAEAFRLDGHEVRVAHAGPQALRELEQYVPDVILLDIGLPGMSGYEIVGLLRKDARLARTLMVALTGFGQDSDRKRAREAGFDEHLVKPVDLEVITALVGAHLLARRE